MFYHAVIARSPRTDNLLSWLDWVARSSSALIGKRWVSGSLEVDVENPPKFQKTRIGANLRRLVLQSSSYQCKKCKKPLEEHDGTAHIHHSVPEVKGGKTELENLVALCVDCHRKAHADLSDNS